MARSRNQSATEILPWEQMRLYYLTSEKWARVILKQRRIKLSTIEELNDPFELLGASIGDKRARKVIRYAYKRLCDSFGIICMSTTWQSPVMWAHYGDKHKGVCLGFDVADGAAKEVLYTPTRLTHLLGEDPSLEDMNHQALNALMTTKYQDWSYENEWRVMVTFEESLEDPSGMHFLPFYDKVFALREVIVGHRCKWGLSEAASAVGKVAQGVNLKRVRPSFEKFEMVRQQRENIIYVKPSKP